MLAQTLPLTKRDIEKAYKPKFINLPEGGTAYLLLGIASLIGWIYSPLVAIGGLLVVWEGMSPANLDPESLTEQEAYLLALLVDEHPVSKETLNTIMRNAIGRCSGDRTLASEVMAEVLKRAYFDTRVGCYSVDNGDKVVHVSTFAEQYFCQLFNAQSRFLHISPKQEAPALFVSAETVIAGATVGNDTRLGAIPIEAVTDHAVAPTQATFNLDDLFDAADPLDETFDLAEALAIAPLEDAKSLLVMGEPGVGKGVFVERWKNALLAAHPNAILYAVNPKPDARESHRWSGFKHVLNVVDEVGATQALASLRKIETALKQRLANPSDIPFGLVIDEYNTLSDLWTNDERAEAAKLIKRIARQGRSLRCRLLLAVHSPNADELSMTASDRACFTSVALARKNNQQTLRIAAQNSYLFPGLPKTVIEQIQARKGQPEVLALCSEYDRMLILPTVTDTPKPLVATAEPVKALSDVERLERLYEGSENVLKPDLEKTFDYIKALIPHVGDKVTFRQVHRSTGAATVGISNENAAELMQDLADADPVHFKYEEKTIYEGNVSRQLVRIS